MKRQNDNIKFQRSIAKHDSASNTARGSKDENTVEMFSSVERFLAI